jgi:hypothetical protein
MISGSVLKYRKGLLFQECYETAIFGSSEFSLTQPYRGCAGKVLLFPVNSAWNQTPIRLTKIQARRAYVAASAMTGRGGSLFCANEQSMTTWSASVGWSRSNVSA